jgi:hypothetical protein
MHRTQYLAGKVLEALALAGIVVALAAGLHGDEWGELYFFLGAIAVFLIGRQMEKRAQRGGDPGKPHEHETVNRTL